MVEHDSIWFELDGQTVTVAIDPLTPLGTVIGVDLGSTSVVEPCGVGACGGCTVVLDGATVLACLTPVGLVHGRSVITIHGLPADDPVVAAFVEADAFQCAYCTPGFVLATHEMNEAGEVLDREAIVAGLAGNLCRCSSYAAIVNAAEAATSG